MRRKLCNSGNFRVVFSPSPGWTSGMQNWPENGTQSGPLKSSLSVRRYQNCFNFQPRNGPPFKIRFAKKTNVSPIPFEKKKTSRWILKGPQIDPKLEPPKTIMTHVRPFGHLKREPKMESSWAISYTQHSPLLGLHSELENPDSMIWRLLSWRLFGAILGDASKPRLTVFVCQKV